jgi:hypothetical protein
MELENLKSEYQNAGKAALSKTDIQKIISENNNPVLKGIKIQLLIETILWAIFLAVYYNIFDGHLKSSLWNFLVVVSVIFILVHNVLGFQIIGNPINGETILESLKNYLIKIKNYAVISIATRVFAIVMLLGYFISTISLTNEKLVSLSFISLVIPVQIYLLHRVWAKRKRRINKMFESLKE